MIVLLIVIGVLTGVTTVVFGFGGGFVTVPVIIWVVVATGGEDAGQIAVATSAVVMVVNAAIATAATRPDVLALLRGRGRLLALLAGGGAMGAVITLGLPPDVASWGFVLYLAATIVDVLVRPGFLRPARDTLDSKRPIPDLLGAPIGTIAALLGVGGSVMTVPLLRRSGLPMGVAAALANPLTLAVSIPATAVFLTANGRASSGGVLMIGVVDAGAAGLLLLGAVPTIVLLRRWPPRIPDRVHAWAYLTLLAAAALAMIPRVV